MRPNQGSIPSAPPHLVSGQGAIATQTNLTMVLQALDRDDNPFLSDTNSSDDSDLSSGGPPPALASHNISLREDYDDSSTDSSQYNYHPNMISRRPRRMPGLIERDRARHDSDTDSD